MCSLFDHVSTSENAGDIEAQLEEVSGSESKFCLAAIVAITKLCVINRSKRTKTYVGHCLTARLHLIPVNRSYFLVHALVFFLFRLLWFLEPKKLNHCLILLCECRTSGTSSIKPRWGSTTLSSKSHMTLPTGESR